MREMNKFGIGFWIGAGVYSMINLILNFNNVSQSKILNYNYLITGVAVFGLILNIIMLKRKKEMKMNNTIKLLSSLLIGAVAAWIARLVHPGWSLTQLLVFGLIVFAVTFILTLLIKKKISKK